MGLASKPKRPQNTDVETLSEILKDRMQIVVVCLSSAWGGLEKIAATDVKDLVEVGIYPLVLCLKDSPFAKDLQGLQGLELIELDYRPRDFLDLRLKRQIAQLVQEGANVFHCHQPSVLGSFAPWLWNKRKVVLICSRHIMNHHDKRNPFHSMLYRRLDSFVVMSEAMRRNVAETHRLKERQIRVIRYGLDFKQFDPERVDETSIREEWGVDRSTIVIGIVGRLDQAKGQSTFIRAAASLLGDTQDKAKRKKLKFVVVGEDTRGQKQSYMEVLKALVAQFHLEDDVIFTGYREDVPQVMKALDIFVMPSRQEAFGLVAIEAMAMGCPVVISSGGSASEIVGEQAFGLLVRPDDAFDLRHQLQYLLSHPKTRVEMGKNARKHVLREYDRKVRLQQTLELYERSMRRRGF